MHSSLNRAQGVFGFFTTVAIFVAGFAALSVLLMPATDAKADVELKNVQVYVAHIIVPHQLICIGLRKWCAIANTSAMENRMKGRPHYYSSKKEEYAQIRFDLDAGIFSNGNSPV